MKSYMPFKEELLRTWFQGFLNNIDDAAATLGLSPIMVAALKDEANAAIAGIDDLLAKKSAYAATVAAKTAAVGSARAFYLNEVGVIKRLPAYTEAIGEALGIIPPAPGPFDPTTYQAKITKAFNSAPNGQVTLRFGKANGNISGVRMYRQIGAQGDWEDLGFKMLTPFVDNTPLAQPGVPEIRSYRCRAVINDEEVGITSDVVQLTVS